MSISILYHNCYLFFSTTPIRKYCNLELQIWNSTLSSGFFRRAYMLVLETRHVSLAQTQTFIGFHRPLLELRAIAVQVLYFVSLSCQLESQAPV